MNLAGIPKKNTPFPFQVTKGCLEDVYSPLTQVFSLLFLIFFLFPLNHRALSNQMFPFDRVPVSEAWQSAGTPLVTFSPWHCIQSEPICPEFSPKVEIATGCSAEDQKVLLPPLL